MKESKSLRGANRSVNRSLPRSKNRPHTANTNVPLENRGTLPPGSGNVLIAVDGGGTQTRCAAFTRDGRILARAESGPSNHLVIDSRQAFQSVLKCIGSVLRQSHVTKEEVAAVSVGLAGVDIGGEGLLEARESLQHFGFERCIVNADMLTAHTGALGGEPGVLVLSGTGAAFYGVTADGRHAKAGGWGPAFGDEGSAYWIGQMVLHAASSAYDGRRPATLLISMICDALGLRDFSETLHCIYRSKMQVRLIAELARTADEAAANGDAVAQKILEDAGDEMARGVEAVVRSLAFNTDDCRVSWDGAVMRNSAVVQQTFTENLARRLPGITVVPPLFDPVYGAYLIGSKAMGWEVAGK